MYCAMHFWVSHWPGEFPPPVWNDWAPVSALVLSVCCIYVGSGSGGGHGSVSCWSWSQFFSRVRCAAVDCAVALWCQSLAALTEASHCRLSLCERSNVWSTVPWNSCFDMLGMPLVPILYCSLIFALTSRSFIWFGCWQWSSSLRWSHCCLACLSIHLSTSEAHFVLDCQSCWLS